MMPKKTHLVATMMLLAAAVLPASPLWTLGAYGDTETSSQNMLQAGEWVNELALFSLRLDEPGEAVIEDGEVAGTSTEPEPEPNPTEAEPVVEISEPIVEITTPESEPASDPTPLAPSASDQPLTSQDLTSEVVPEPDPQPASTPTEDPAS